MVHQAPSEILVHRYAVTVILSVYHIHISISIPIYTKHNRRHVRKLRSSLKLVFVGSAGFYRGRRRIRRRWIKYDMQSKPELATAAGSTTTKKMALLFGIYSLSLRSKMKTEKPSNSSGN